MTQGVPYVPTEEQRRTVKAMSGLGVPHDGIAVLLEIDPKTLRKHFHAELERGSVEATAKVAQSLFQMATSGKNVAAAIFWMKARAGWREKHDITVRNDLEDLTDEQLLGIIEGHVVDLGATRLPDGRLALGTDMLPGTQTQHAPDVQHRPTTVGRW